MLGGRDEAGSATGRRPPWGLVGMLALVLAIELSITQKALDLIAPNRWDWRDAGNAANHADRVCDREVLIFGDSVIKYSLMPGVIRNLSGRRSFSLALSSGQTSSSYFLLRRALRTGATPSAVILDVTPHMFMYSPKINQQIWCDLLTPEETLDLARTMGDADFFSQVVLAETLPSCQYRHEIRARVLAMFDGTAMTPKYQNLVYLRNWRVNDGAQLEHLNPPPVFDPDTWTLNLYPFWAPDPVNMAYLDRFLALAESRKIPVYWLLPPVHPAVQYRIERSGFDQAYLGFVRQVQSRFPGTVVVDARHTGFVEADFKDVVHLNRGGAMRLSAAVADFLDDRDTRKDRVSWVALDRGRARTLDLPMEDLVKSAEVLRDEGRKSRR